QSTLRYKERARGVAGAAGGSPVAEDRREGEGDEGGPGPVHGEVGRLPALQGGEGGAAQEEAEVEPGRPGEVDEEDDVLAERRQPVEGGAELRDPGGDGR